MERPDSLYCTERRSPICMSAQEWRNVARCRAGGKWRLHAYLSTPVRRAGTTGTQFCTLCVDKIVSKHEVQHASH